MALPRRAILDLHAMAKTLSDPADAARCHAVAQACSAVHTEAHAIGLAVYELTAIARESPPATCTDALDARITAYEAALPRCRADAPGRPLGGFPVQGQPSQCGSAASDAVKPSAAHNKDARSCHHGDSLELRHFMRSRYPFDPCFCTPHKAQEKAHFTKCGTSDDFISFAALFCLCFMGSRWLFQSFPGGADTNTCITLNPPKSQFPYLLGTIIKHPRKFPGVFLIRNEEMFLTSARSWRRLLPAWPSCRRPRPEERLP